MGSADDKGPMRGQQAQHAQHASGSLRLTVRRTTGTTTVTLPARGTFVFGRDTLCDVSIEDATLSRRHALLYAAGELFLEDAGSRNGTRLDGRRLAPQERAPWPLGKPVTMGAVTITVERVAAKPSRGSSTSRRARAEARAAMVDVERERIRAAIAQAKGDFDEAARILGMSRRALGNTLNDDLVTPAPTDVMPPYPPKR